MKSYSLLVLIVLGIYNGHSQNTVHGVVRDAENQKPLEQVSVYLPQLEKGAVSDIEGNFEIRNLPAGHYKLVASYIGYTTFSANIMVGDSTSSVIISLSPSAIEMEEVIVSTPFHKLQRENVMKVEHARLADLKAKGSITLADGISKIPGVESVSTGLGIGKPVIRGLSANRVLVYSQGVRLENQQFGDEHGLGLNDAGIESVEVIKGPASLLYGSDALGGVLYINPEKFAMASQSEGDVGLNYFSNTRGYTANAGFKNSGERFKFLLRGALASHADYEGGDGLHVTNSRFREYDIKTGIGFQNSTLKSELRYNLNTSDLGIPEATGVRNRERAPEFPFQEIDNHILSLDTDLFFRNSSLQLTLGYIFNNRKEFEEHEEEAAPSEGVEGPALHMQLETVNYNLQYHLPRTEKLETIIGIQGMHQTNENLGEEILIPDATTDDLGLLATSHLHFNKSDLQFGLRYDHRSLYSSTNGISGEEGFIPGLDRSFNSFNAALGYRIDIGKSIIGRVNLASGFRAPNLAELTSNGVHEGTNRYEIGDPELENEQNIQTDIALEFKNEHFEFYVNGFYNKLDHYIYIEPNGEFIESDAVFLYRQQNAALYGGEIGMHIHPHPLDWLHFESSLETVRGKLDSGDNLPLIPAASLGNTLRMEFEKNLNWLHSSYVYVDVNTVFSQNKVNAYETETGGYTLLNVGFGGLLRITGQDIELRLSTNNLFDKAYISHLSRLKPDGIVNIGRNISLALTVRI
jgi:iron complex outermembrane receptor protein